MPSFPLAPISDSNNNYFAPKRYTQPALLACLCLNEYVHLDYRSVEALLASAQELRAALALRAGPDHSTLWWFQRHKVKPHLLARWLTDTVGLFRHHGPARTRTVAVESTGFAREQTSPSDQFRAGKRLPARNWLKWSVAVWTGPLVLCGQIADRGREATMSSVALWWNKPWPGCPSLACWPMGAMMRRPTTAGCEKTWASRASFRRLRDGHRVASHRAPIAANCNWPFPAKSMASAGKLRRLSRSSSGGLAGRSRRVATGNRSNRPCCAASPTICIGPSNWGARGLSCPIDSSGLLPEVFDRASQREYIM
jgi:hypothetical protein